MIPIHLKLPGTALPDLEPGQTRIVLAGDGDSEHFLLTLSRHTLLGSAFVALASARIDVVACREDRSDIEEAFVALTGDGGE